MKHRVMIVVNNGKNWAECSQRCNFGTITTPKRIKENRVSIPNLVALKRVHERGRNG